MNLISVKAFGEFEFWAALIKVLALTTFLVVGIVFLAGRFKIEGRNTGPSLWADHGGFLPTGLLPLVLVTSGVIFAYAAVELVGTAAGETAEPEKVMPRAINSVIVRIAVFYCGSVLLLALLLPYTAYKHPESPFVTFFSKVGLTGAGCLMNVVVLTAAFSSLNAGLYSRPDPAVDVGERQRSEVHRTHVEKRCAVRRDPADGHHRAIRCRAQRGQTGPGL